MNSKVVISELQPKDWQRLRDLRFAALADSPENLSGNLAEEKNYTQEKWLEFLNKVTWVVASIDGRDVGLVNVENLEGDFGATCWVGGLWLDPTYRGQGVAKAIFDYLDANSDQKGWRVQGLGVMENNPAVKTFERLGFVKMGEPQESRGKPGNYYYRMIKAL